MIDEALLDEVWAEVQGLLDEGEDLDSLLEELTANAAVNQPKSLETGKFKPNNAGTGKGEEHKAAQKGALNVTEDDRRRGSEVGDAEVPGWAADERKWRKAKQEAEAGGHQDANSAAACIYRKMGGSFKETTVNKAAKVAFLVTNCKCEEETLNELSDDAIDAMYDNSLVANAAREVGKLEDGKFVVNEFPPKKKDEEEEEEEEEEVKKKPVENRLTEEEQRTLNWAKKLEAKAHGEAVEKLVANLDKGGREAARKVYSAMSLDQLEPLVNALPKEPAQKANIRFDGAPGSGGLTGNSAKKAPLRPFTLNSKETKRG